MFRRDSAAPAAGGRSALVAAALLVTMLAAPRLAEADDPAAAGAPATGDPAAAGAPATGDPAAGDETGAADPATGDETAAVAAADSSVRQPDTADDPAAADQASVATTAPSRGFHWALGGGGFAAVSGPSEWGTAVGLELLPGGPLRRVGLIGLARFDENAGDSGMAAGGVVFEAAAARPRLWLALHAEVGATWGPSQPVAGVGIKSHLMIWGPFAVSIDGTAHLVYDGVDSQLAVASTLLLELAR